MSLKAGDRRRIPNIGPRGIARRRRQGAVALAGGGFAALVLAFIGSWWAGLATFPFFWAGALQLLQAHEKT
jgi:hypothetical protein